MEEKKRQKSRGPPSGAKHKGWGGDEADPGLDKPFGFEIRVGSNTADCSLD